MSRIAVVGVGCRYPGANSPDELWENAVSGRRAFRRIPPERLSLVDYHDEDPRSVDTFYTDTAAVIEGYEFDRVGYRIAGSTFRNTDLTHWLSLDVTAEALRDAGYPMAEGLPNERTTVVIGNTLTGEFSRASVLRLRWPYVRRVLTAQLREQGWDDDRIVPFVTSLEARYKSPFPEPDEDTLAGGLANTIAGRICNYFDLKGGGYTVDGACSSSLLSVVTAARALRAHDADVAVTGGVDLSIDPFELVGFARTGALARSEMRMYDKGSNGFWPGEGCGILVLMREEDARAEGRTPYGYISGFGISSDGSGGITRPEVDGYRLALRRAYESAGFDISTVGYFEGHGTGTEVGDATELRAIGDSLRASGGPGRPAPIGSIKGQIGHTKAAAGVAGLIKALQVVHHGVVPPTVGCRDPHPEFLRPDAALRPVPVAEPWPESHPLRAAVTSMGFGGINAHIVVEADEATTDWDRDGRTRAIAAGRQDQELLVMSAPSAAELTTRLLECADRLETASYAEVGDIAVDLQRRDDHDVLRAAWVATSPKSAAARARLLAAVVTDHPRGLQVLDGGSVFFARAGAVPRIGYLFPGQGTGSSLRGGALARRFPAVAEVYRLHQPGEDVVATEEAQPLVAVGSAAALQALDAVGLRADVAIGHSLGELSAMCWAGALDRDRLVDLARVRGKLMAGSRPEGTMVSLAAGRAEVESLLVDGAGVAVVNSPRHTVVSGTREAVDEVVRRARARAVTATPLPVSHAFHSPLMAAAADELHRHLSETPPGPAGSAIVSTVTADLLTADTDWPEHLRAQVTRPVRFAEALTRIRDSVDLLVEVGPGTSMARLCEANGVGPVVSTDTDDGTLTSFLSSVGAAWVLGAAPRIAELGAGRLARAVRTRPARFFANPAEAAPATDIELTTAHDAQAGPDGAPDADVDVLEVLRELAAERAELPVDLIGTDSRLLEDLHLSSITAGQILARAGKAVGVAPDQVAVNLAVVTLGEVASALEARRGDAAIDDGDRSLHDLGDWVGTWQEVLLPQRLPARPARAASAGAAGTASGDGSWTAVGDGGELCASVLERLQERLPAGGLVVVPGTLTGGTTGTTGTTGTDRSGAAERTAFQAAKMATTLDPGQHCVFLGGGAAVAALAKTLHLEHPDLRVTIVEAEPPALTAEQIVDETAATEAFSHVVYRDGGRLVPHLVPYVPAEPPAGSPQPVLGADDVLVATGGARGITAECVHSMAAGTGARVALLGRGDAAQDEEIRQTLARLADAGVESRYVQVDVTDAGAVREALATVRAELGEVTGILHGAGGNTPRSLASLSWPEVRSTMAPKVDGLANLLAAVDPARLRLLVTFGSVIGRFGLWGEAHYAMANAELARMTQEFAAAHPTCRTSCLEWSVWSEIGMGARLDAVESLRRNGITPIDPATGTGVLGRALADPGVPAAVVVSGRTDQVPTARYVRGELPLGRFLEHVKRYYPRHELVVEAVLSPELDPYLTDHVLDGNALLPAVFGMEAMAQVGTALRETPEAPRTEDVRFLRPIVVPAGGLRIRVSAVARDARTLAVSIASEETDFAVPHFTATLVFDGRPPAALVGDVADDGPGVAIDPQTELYGSLLFQGGRFHRLRSYQVMTSRHVAATVVPDPGVRWFAGHLPGGLVLGDPGVRDALMHGNQVCIPDSTLLPEGVDAITVAAARADGPLTLRSVEREHTGNLHVYDVDVVDGAGAVVETWQGLRLRAVRTRMPDAWPVPLLGPHLERVLRDGDVSASVTASAGPDDDIALSLDGPGVVGGRAVQLNGEYSAALEAGAVADLHLDRARDALAAAGVDAPPVHRGQARGAEEFVAGSHRVYVLVAHTAGRTSPHLLTVVAKEEA